MAQPSIELSLREVDLSALPAAEKEFVWTRIAREQGRKAFDLAKPPLFRATLAHLGQQAIYCCWRSITSWPMSGRWRCCIAICTEFTARLRGGGLPRSCRCRFNTPTLPPGSANFSPGEILDRQASYWKAQLAGAPTVLDLATDKPRLAVQSFRGAAMSMKFPVEVIGARQGAGPRGKSHAVHDFYGRVHGFGQSLHRPAGHSGGESISAAH